MKPDSIVKTSLIYLAIFSFILSCPVFSAAQDFKIGTGDRLTISVYGHDDLSLTVRVSDEGSIKVPFLGNIQAAGVTAADLSKKLAAEYVREEYLVNPQITVFIDEYKSRKASILGEVSKPGRYELDEDTTVMILVTMASGYTAKASKKYANIIRTDGEKKEIRERVPLDERVLPGDVVVIPESFF